MRQEQEHNGVYRAGRRGTLDGAAGLVRLCALLLLAAAASVWPGGSAEAQVEVRLSCDDFEDVDSCSVEGQDAFSGGLVELTDRIITLIDDNGGTGEFCTDEGNGQYLCGTPGGLEFACTTQSQNGDITAASCGVSGPEGELDYLSFGCQSQRQGGSCLFSADVESLEDEFGDAISDAGGNPQNVSLARSLAAACGARQGLESFQRDCDAILQLYNEGRTGQAAEAIAAVTPMNFDTSMEAASQIADGQQGNVQQRFQGLRQGSTGVDISGFRLYDDGNWWSPRQLLVQNSAASQTETDVPTEITDFGRLAFFVNGRWVTGSQDATNLEGANDVDSQGITAGADYRIDRTTVAGVALGYSQSYTDFADGAGELETTGYTMTLYGTYYTGPAYVDATISYGGSEFDQERVLRCSAAACGSPIDQEARAEYFGSDLSLAIAGGYDFPLGRFGVAPFAQLQHSRTTIDAHTERMSDPNDFGGGLGLSIERQELITTTAELGARGRVTFNQSWGVLQPQASVTLIRELNTEANEVDGRFTGDSITQAKFQLSAEEIDSTYFEVGIGAAATLPHGRSAFLFFETIEGYEGLTQRTFTGGFRWEF